jgi:molybdopterin molybdotransferase
MKMINVQEAERLILENVRPFPAEDINLTEAGNRVLADKIIADRDHPPLDRATMDGIAVKFSVLEKGRRSFSIASVAAAGAPLSTLADENQAVEIMTGAPVPDGCDCVIPYEDLKIENGTAAVFEKAAVKSEQNIHTIGADYQKGDLLLEQGTRMGPTQIAVAAAVGKTRIKVFRIPKIAVIGTGNELVDIDRPVKPHQVRRSNAYALEALLARHGFPGSARYHLRDDKSELRIALKELLKKFDILILSGGVSRGKFDYIPEILNDLNVKVLFHRVLQKPGKPFWFGMEREGRPVFALPGNPVSTMVTAVRYVLPYLRQVTGDQREGRMSLPLSAGVENKHGLTFFAPVKFVHQPGKSSAIEPLPFKGSGNFADLAHSDGFAEIPPGPVTVSAGMAVPFYEW